jgi:hypothetical protein
MVVIEEFLQSKNGDLLTCQDAIYVGSHFACVVDGATSQSKLHWDGQKPGKFVSMVVCDAVASFSKTIARREAIRTITDRIAAEYHKRALYKYTKKNPSERLTASLVLYNRYRSEVWMVGDCQCSIDGEVIKNTNAFGTLLAEVRSLFIQTELLSGITIGELQKIDTGREYIIPLLKRQGLLQNRLDAQYSFGVVDGFEIDEQFIKTIGVPKNAKTIILASDGYPVLHNTLEETERALQNALREDPLCILEHKSTKGKYSEQSSHDDRAYLKIDL